MARYATAECIYCHIRLPKPEMYSEKIKVEVGRSGMSASFNPSRKKSGRIHSGRSYYRTKEIWYCINCEEVHQQAKDDEASANFTAAFWYFVFAIGLGLGFYLFIKHISETAF